MKSCNKNVYRFSITSRCILKVNKAEKVWNNNKTVININFQIILFIMVSNALLPFSLSFNTSYCRRKKENLLICHFDFFCCRKSHNYTLFLIQRAHAHKKGHHSAYDSPLEHQTSSSNSVLTVFLSYLQTFVSDHKTTNTTLRSESRDSAKTQFAAFVFFN